MEPFLSLRHVSKTFHANRALNDISIDFMPGEVHCLAGQNGCGKSTLIKIISGVYRPDEGAAMTLGGKTWPKLTPAASVAHGIQVIYQDLSLFPNLSVWENIAINHYHRGVLVRRSELPQYGMVVMLQKVGGNFAVAFVLAGGIGVLLGLMNALLVNRLRVPSIIITISTLNIFYGLLLWLSKGVWLYDFPPWFEKGVMLFKYTDADGYDYGLGLPLLTMIAVVLLTAFIMNFTTVGRKIYAMGGNRESASRVGFSVLRLQLFVYGYMGLMSGAAGVVQAWTVMTVAPDSLLGYELTVLAAVVLGGTSLIGGRGTLTGTLLGVILLAVMQNGLNLLGVSSYWQTLITGAIIVVSISVTAWSQHQNRSLL